MLKQKIIKETLIKQYFHKRIVPDAGFQNTESSIFRHSQEGYLTIALILILSAVLPLILMMFTGAEKNGARMDSAYAYDASMDAILSEYNRELLKQYDVFFVDLSYGSGKPGTSSLDARVMYYMNGNFTAKGNGIPTLTRTFYKMSAEGVKTNDVSIATDDKGLVFRRQAEDFIADLDGFSLLSTKNLQKNAQKLEEKKDTIEEVNKKREKNKEKLEDLSSPGSDDDENVGLLNAANGISDLRDQAYAASGFLGFVTDLSEVSHMGFNGRMKPASMRKLQTGDGVNPELFWEEGANRLLFFQYLAMKASDFTHYEDKNAMKYQLEYVLKGSNDDYLNLRKTVTELVFLREAINSVYIFKDHDKVTLCKTIGAVIAVLCEDPQLEDPIKEFLLYTWAFVESLNDVKILLSGKRLAIDKRGQNWQTSLWQILDPWHLPGGEGAESGGLSYRDHLIAMIFLQNIGTTTMRFLDMVEQDIRKVPGNSNFLIDQCADSFDITVLTRSSTGDVFQETRRYGYP